MGATARLAELGITLPPVLAPSGSYDPCVLVGTTLHVGGHGPVDADTVIRGEVGKDLDLSAARHDHESKVNRAP